MKSYTLDNLKQIIASNAAPLVLFGAGNVGELALYALKKHGIQVDYFCDSDAVKQGHDFLGIPVISIEKSAEIGLDAHIFISNFYITPVELLLQKLNFRNIYSCTSIFENTDFSSMSSEWPFDTKPRHNYTLLGIQKMLSIYSITSQRAENENSDSIDVKYVDVVITERCSMKCKDCSNLMQYYVDPKDSDLEELFSSIDRLMKSVDSIYEFRVLGGEPFMNKEIHKIINRLVSYQMISYVTIYTNATILPKDENLLCLKNEKVRLDITNYGELSRNHDKLIETLKANNISYTTFIPDSWTDSGTIKYRERTKDELVHMFKNCCVNDYFTLLNGKLYRCPFAANAINLNAIPFDADEVIDISDESKDIETLKKEINHLYNNKEYISSCKYCGGRDYTTPRIKAGVQTKQPIPIPAKVNI